MMKKIFSLIIFFLIFSAVSILLSLWLGLIWRNSLFILLVSLIISYFIFKKFRIEIFVPLRIYALGLLVFLMAAYPLLLIHPFYNASADPTSTITTIVIGDKIPETYAPYSNLSYRYVVGFQLFAKIFMDFLPFFPPYLITWFLGAIFAFLQLILIYVLAKIFFNSDTAGEWAAILFIGAKIVFQNMYWGQYSWLMGTVFFLAALAALLSKSKLAYLFFPVIFIIHPGPAFNILLFLAAYFLFFRQEFSAVATLILSLLLAIPSFLKSYFYLIYNTLFGGIHSFSFTISGFLRLSLLIPPWIGIIPFFFAVLGIGWSIKKRDFNKKKFLLLFLLLISAFLNVFFGVFGTTVAGRVIELAAISAILLGSIFLTEIRMDSTKYANLVKAVIIIFCLYFFFSSTILNHLRSGSKITPDEAAFAIRFKEIDPELSETLFLSPGGGKMAEISNKIPFNVRLNWFLPTNEVLIANDPNLDEFVSKSAKWHYIVDNNRVEYIYDLNVDYVVINKEFFNNYLQKEPIFSYKQFDLYRLRS